MSEATSNALLTVVHPLLSGSERGIPEGASFQEKAGVIPARLASGQTGRLRVILRRPTV